MFWEAWVLSSSCIINIVHNKFYFGEDMINNKIIIPTLFMIRNQMRLFQIIFSICIVHRSTSCLIIIKWLNYKRNPWIKCYSISICDITSDRAYRSNHTKCSLRSFAFAFVLLWRRTILKNKSSCLGCTLKSKGMQMAWEDV